MVTNVCINNTGCIVAKRVNNQSLCYACNRTLYFVLAKNVCECRDGYELSGSKCTEKCGDGRLFVLDCDDGNKIDGDGCSSNCKIENKYKCARGSFSTPSVCQYQRSDITIAPVLIDRADTMNRAKLVFAFSPNLLSLGKNNFS
jgi:cysteine-rich repeat protein